MATKKQAAEPNQYVKPINNLLGLPQFELRGGNHRVLMTSVTMYGTVEDRDKAMAKLAQDLGIEVKDES